MFLLLLLLWWWWLWLLAFLSDWYPCLYLSLSFYLSLSNISKSSKIIFFFLSSLLITSYSSFSLSQYSTSLNDFIYFNFAYNYEHHFESYSLRLIKRWIYSFFSWSCFYNVAGLKWPSVIYSIWMLPSGGCESCTERFNNPGSSFADLDWLPPFLDKVFSFIIPYPFSPIVPLPLPFISINSLTFSSLYSLTFYVVLNCSYNNFILYYKSLLCCYIYCCICLIFA